MVVRLPTVKGLLLDKGYKRWIIGKNEPDPPILILDNLQSSGFNRNRNGFLPVNGWRFHPADPPGEMPVYFINIDRKLCNNPAERCFIPIYVPQISDKQDVGHIPGQSQQDMFLCRGCLDIVTGVFFFRWLHCLLILI